MPQNVHSRIHSFNKSMLITYYTFKHNRLSSIHLRPSQSINLAYIPSFYIAFIFLHLQNHKSFLGGERERKNAYVNSRGRGEKGERETFFF